MNRNAMNHTTGRIALAAAALAVGLSLAGPAAAARAYVHVAPPPVRVEVRSVAPSPRHVWHEGYWRWDGGVHVWVAGAWVLPPHLGAVWVGGRWKSTPSGWYRVEGHWRH